MKVLVLSRLFYPHVGGVEKHVLRSSILNAKKNKITLITENFSNNKEYSNFSGINVYRFKYPYKKIIGLLKIWYWLYKNRDLIKEADVIHCHDVFIWYLPFRLFFYDKKVVTTIHGFEWDNPFNPNSLFQKRLAVKFSNKTVGIGHFLERYLYIKFDILSYGASDIHRYKTPKDKKRIVYVGRLEENTGVLKFLKWLDKNPGYKVDFCGDGNLKTICEKYGTVHGFSDPNPFYKVCKTAVPGGYLAALEALNTGCDIKLFWNNKLKEDYWKMSPFYKLKGKKLYNWAREQTWEKLANEYLDLYNSIK